MRLVRVLCAMPLVVLDALGAGALYLAMVTVPRDARDDDALTGIEAGSAVTVACAAVTLLVAWLLRSTLSRWWVAPAAVLLLAGGARWAYSLAMYPP